MLYITTRNTEQMHTAHLALTNDTGAEGGRYVPFRLMRLSSEELASLKQKPFNQIVAEILNLFFSSRLSAWDVDFCICKNPVRIISMNHRIILSEFWHNPDARFSYMISRLSARLCGDQTAHTPTDWTVIAIRIAVMFGLYGQICSQELVSSGVEFDIVVPSDDFVAPMAALYARQMGLPVNTVICSCDGDSELWELIHRGSFNTSAACDSLLLGLERLILTTLGGEEVSRFCQCCARKRVYSVTEEQLKTLSAGLFCAVAGKNRAEATVNSLFRTNHYIVDPVTALCFSGLQDYRSGTGTSRVTLLMAERTPMDFMKEISAATGIQEQKLIEHVKL